MWSSFFKYFVQPSNLATRTIAMALDRTNKNQAIPAASFTLIADLLGVANAHRSLEQSRIDLDDEIDELKKSYFVSGDAALKGSLNQHGAGLDNIDRRRQVALATALGALLLADLFSLYASYQYSDHDKSAESWVTSFFRVSTALFYFVPATVDYVFSEFFYSPLAKEIKKVKGDLFSQAASTVETLTKENQDLREENERLRGLLAPPAVTEDSQSSSGPGLKKRSSSGGGSS